MREIKTRKDIIEFMDFNKHLNAYELRLIGSYFMDAMILEDENISDYDIFHYFQEAIDDIEKSMKNKIKELRKAVGCRSIKIVDTNK